MNDTVTDTVSLTADRVESLLQVERMLHDLLPQIDNLEKCGTKCELIRQQARTVADQARKLRQYFSPPGLAAQ